jgi:hypothetical protein
VDLITSLEGMKSRRLLLLQGLEIRPLSLSARIQRYPGSCQLYHNKIYNFLSFVLNFSYLLSVTQIIICLIIRFIRSFISGSIVIAPWLHSQLHNPIHSRQDSLDGGSVCHKAAICVQNNMNIDKRTQTSMPRVKFEHTTPEFERAKTAHASDGAATVIGY